MSTVYLSYQGHSFQIRIEYPYSKEEMDAHFAKMDQLAPTLKGETEYDTVKNVHDYLQLRIYEGNTEEVLKYLKEHGYGKETDK